MSVNVTVTPSGSANSSALHNITISAWFRGTSGANVSGNPPSNTTNGCAGCVQGPDSAQATCCTQAGSPPTMINGTFGCPYNNVFGDPNSNNSAPEAGLQKCCEEITTGCFTVCVSFISPEEQMHIPYPGSISSTPTPTSATSASPSPTHNEAGKHRYSGMLFGILLLPLLFVN